MIYCLNLYDDVVLWNRAIDPGIDRLAVHPSGRLLYVPTWEGGSADFINVLDARTGDFIRKVYFSNRSHDTLFPPSGPLFQETKAEDGSGKYLYLIDPQSYEVSRVGPYAGILGPYAVDGMSRYVVNNVKGLWGMQVAELKSGLIVTASLAEHPPGEPGLLHGIGWTPDEREVWQSSSASDPHIFIWNMRDPMVPVLVERVSMRSRQGAHWITFDIEGNYAYVAPNKSSDDSTEIFDAHTHKSLALIGSSEDRFRRWQDQPRRRSVWRRARRARLDELIDAGKTVQVSLSCGSARHRGMKRQCVSILFAVLGGPCVRPLANRPSGSGKNRARHFFCETNPISLLERTRA